MSNIVERFQKLEAEQTKREAGQKEREKREFEEAINERTAVVNRELVNQIRPLVSILKDTRIEEILKGIQKVRKDLNFNIELGAEFSTVAERYFWEYKNFSNISDIFSSEIVFPLPYREGFYPYRVSESLQEAKSLKLEKEMFLRIKAKWGHWGEESKSHGHNYIYIEPKYLKKGEILKVTDGRGENILNEEQLKSQQVVEDTIILAILNPKEYYNSERQDWSL